jgi:hypothetical protein
MTVQFRLNRILASVVFAVLFGALIQHDYSKWSRLGRAAYLQYESGLFDRDMGPGHPVAAPMLGVSVVIIPRNRILRRTIGGLRQSAS